MIILDFDGTMFDTGDSYVKTRRALSYYYNIKEDLFTKINNRRYLSEISFMNELVKLNIDKIENVYNQYLIHYKKYGLPLISDQYNFIINIDFFKENNTVIVSNGLSEVIQLILNKFCINSFFPERYSYSLKLRNFNKKKTIRNLLKHDEKNFIISDNIQDFEIFNENNDLDIYGKYLGKTCHAVDNHNIDFVPKDFFNIVNRIKYEK